MSHQFTNGHAIIIGVGADLPTTIDDARALADFLKNPAYCAYPPEQVHCLTGVQADRNGILTTLDTLAGNTDNTSTIVFYFSGHGWHTKRPYVGQTYFLMPYDYDVENLAETAISGQEFADKMRVIPAQKTLIMLDCCRAGGLDVADAKAAGAEFTKAPLPDSVIQQLTTGGGYAFIASSPADKLSYAGKPYSAFTTALLEALGGRGNARKDGYVRVADIAMHCREMVPQRTRLKKDGPQRPLLNYEQADNFVVAYYAGGDTAPKSLPFTEPEIEDVPGLFDGVGTPSIQIPVGSGAAAHGYGNIVLGASAVNVGGNVTGNINTGTIIEKQIIQLPDYTADELALRQAYLTGLLDDVSRLSLAGVDPGVTTGADARLDLSAVYTTLITIEQDDSQLFDETHTGQGELFLRHKQASRRVSALEQLDRHARLVLLGDPGSGKSTFVNFVVLCMAGELTGSETFNVQRLIAPLPDDNGQDQAHLQAWHHGALLPVRVILRDFVAAGLPPMGQSATGQHLWAFIERSLSQSLPEYVPHLRRTLLEEGGLICLDGLDEVPAAGERRVQIKQAIEQFAATFSRCRFLVTSRTYANQQQAWRLTRFEETLLAPFGAGQIRRFVERWYTYIGTLRGWTEADTTGRAALLERAIFGSDRLRALAERPLLLTLMASLHAWRGGTLPEKREELYSDTVDLLLDWWERRRVRRDADSNMQVDQPSLAEWLKTDRVEVRRLLNRLAFEAHAGQTELVGTADIPETALLNGLLQLNKNPDVMPRRLIEYLSQRAGLLIARGVGVYTFPHRTFQEYLAACHLTTYAFPDKLAELTRTEPDRWREVALLAGANVRRGKMPASIWLLADALCFELFPRSKSVAVDIDDLWGAQIAGELLIETGAYEELVPRHQVKCRNIAQWLVHIVQGSQLPASERALAGRTVTLLGDTRPEVMTLDSLQLCYVPQGPFWVGGSDTVPELEDDIPSLKEFNLPYAYWISRFPISNAQFTQFVEANGYADANLWPEARELGVWHDGFVKGSSDDRWRDRPHEFGQPYGMANHPVVGLMWYEALAYSRWLTKLWRAQKFISADWCVRLPSETEWEKAARGGFQIPDEPIIRDIAKLSAPVQVDFHVNPFPKRIYPWGDIVNAEYANVQGAEIGTTSCVGCFAGGVTVYGCEEMSGNVFDWTCCSPDMYAYAEHAGMTSPAFRIMRGGYFGDDGRWSHCAYRAGPYPDILENFIGFRIVVSPFSPTNL